MGDSRRLAALKNLVTAMGTIASGDGGYATDVATVLKEFIDWETGPPRGALPQIAVVPLEATYEYLATYGNDAGLRVNQAVAVEYVYQSHTQDDAWQTGDELADDIIAAASVDRTRGGNALDTRVTSVETDAGNADTMDSRGGISAGIVRFNIILTRTLGVS